MFKFSSVMLYGALVVRKHDFARSAINFLNFNLRTPDQQIVNYYSIIHALELIYIPDKKKTLHHYDFPIYM